MCVLSLDISTSSTGWCVTEDGKSFTFGTLLISPKLRSAERLTVFSGMLESILKEYSPTQIVQEDIFVGRNVSTMKVLCEFTGISKYICYNTLNIDPFVISNKAVKSYFKAKDKQLLFNFMCEILEKEYSFKKDNDRIDSLAQIMCYTDSILGIYSYRTDTDYGYIYNGGYISGE
ncbi:crossover junction endodeoxyribonuclease RuvC [bacterium]|nr:crossover junction endodeoxyribonuclease RuvC [bacterium]